MIHPETLTALAFKIRGLSADDVPFVMQTWQKWCRDTEPFRRMKPEGHYNLWMTRRIERLLRRGRIVVGCKADAPELIYGWAVGEHGDPPAVHFVYTKKGYRHLGVATMLLAELVGREPVPFEFTHWPADESAWVLGKYGRAKFNPMRTD